MSWVPSPSTARHLFYGILIGFSLSIASTSVVSAYRKRRDHNVAEIANPRPIELRSDEVLDGVTGLIGTRPATDLPSQTDRLIGAQGNTPLVRINSLSNALGVEILGKAEVRLSCDAVAIWRCCLLTQPLSVLSQYLNPGGSVKDRVALKSMFDIAL